VNGSPADLLIYYVTGELTGRVLGYRREEGYLMQKGYDTLAPGDSVTILYEVAAPGETPSGWRAVPLAASSPLTAYYRAATRGDNAVIGELITDTKATRTATVKRADA
jgi:hypothetical protein